MSHRASGLEEHLMCSICLEIFTDPVSTPCEHNFCKGCITKHWDSSSVCQCPLCKSSFSVRPYLRVNTLLSQIVHQVKKQIQEEVHTQEDSSSDQQEIRPGQSKPVESTPGQVLCDACAEPKQKALKSCLVCLSSFCESHLQPHLSVSGLKKHQLMEPVDDLEDRMCPTHDRPLELFCDTDKKIVCMMCSVLEHKNHDFLPLKEAFEQEKASLLQTVVENQRLVEQRRLKVQEIRAALDHTQREAIRETDQMVKLFSDIVEKVQRCLDHHTEIIEQTQSKHKTRAQALMALLQQEMTDLENRTTEAQQLQRSTDHLYFLQHYTALTPPAGLKEWSNMNFQPANFQGTTARALSTLNHDLRRLTERIITAELKRVQTFATDVTLDPDTAHYKLILSKDKKKVHHSEAKKKSPENKERFSESLSVLGEQTFSSGRAYFEVQVEGKTKWEVGVAKESINRKGKIKATPAGGFWAVSLKEGGEYSALTDPAPLRLAPPLPPLKLGVFVDSVEGVVSFHDPDSTHLLHSFSRCNFTEPVLPYLSPGTKDHKNSAPLVLLGGVEPDPAPTSKNKKNKMLTKAVSEQNLASE